MMECTLIRDGKFIRIKDDINDGIDDIINVDEIQNCSKVGEYKIQLRVGFKGDRITDYTFDTKDERDESYEKLIRCLDNK